MGNTRPRPKPTAPAPHPRVLDSSDGPPDLVLATIDRGDRNRLMITVGEFPPGNLRVDVRSYRITAKGSEFRPTVRGAAIRPAELDAVIAALERARGLIAEHRPGALDAPAGEGAGHDG